MNYLINEKELAMLTECLEITIKEVGLKGLYTIVELVQLLEHPISTNEKGIREYTFNEKSVASFKMVFDVTLKRLGIDSLPNITGLINLLDNPLVVESTVDTEVMEVEA